MTRRRPPPPRSSDPPRLLTLAHVAAQLDLSLATVKRIVGRGELASVKIDGRRLVRADVLAQWIDEQSS